MWLFENVKGLQSLKDLRLIMHNAILFIGLEEFCSCCRHAKLKNVNSRFISNTCCKR